MKLYMIELRTSVVVSASSEDEAISAARESLGELSKEPGTFEAYVLAQVTGEAELDGLEQGWLMEDRPYKVGGICQKTIGEILGSVA
jgi:hypothetical protein